jgi:hypothetical protein
MHDATQIDLAATALAYRAQHADWEGRVDRRGVPARRTAAGPGAQRCRLPAAGRRRTGRHPSLAMCSLNWADLFAHFFAHEPWAAAIHRQMLAAYDGAECFLRLTPGMAMADLRTLRRIGPVAALGERLSPGAARATGCASDERLVLIAFGGIEQATADRRLAA